MTGCSGFLLKYIAFNGETVVPVFRRPTSPRADGIVWFSNCNWIVDQECTLWLLNGEKGQALIEKRSVLREEIKLLSRLYSCKYLLGKFCVGKLFLHFLQEISWTNSSTRLDHIFLQKEHFETEISQGSWEYRESLQQSLKVKYYHKCNSSVHLLLLFTLFKNNNVHSLFYFLIAVAK